MQEDFGDGNSQGPGCVLPWWKALRHRISRLISRQGILAHGWGRGAGLGRLTGGLQVRRGRRRGEYQDDDDVLVEVKQVHNPVCSTLRYSPKVVDFYLVADSSPMPTRHRGVSSATRVAHRGR